MKQFLFWLITILALISTVALAMIIINWSINTPIK
jgi:hypothetical protein